MAKSAQRRIIRTGFSGALILGLVALSGLGAFALRSRGKPSLPEDLPLAAVRRADLHSTVTAPGEIDSSEKTLIECELENVRFRNGGASIQASGSSIIIELVPEGTMVEKDQVLCRLNSSEYEEMVRQQQIELEEDRAEMESARLKYETLEVALEEYREGLYKQLKEQYQGQIALAKADVERQTDRLAWSERMEELGYITQSTLRSEQNLMLRTELTLKQANIAYDNLVKYTAPKTILSMQGQLDGARAQLTYREIQVQRDREQLAEYQEQVDNCTIRAPHDGFLIYANKRGDDTAIELGTVVRENQDLFYLPDLSQMEVKARLHETVVNRVESGMPVRVKVEALPNVELEGEVVAVAPLPMTKRSWYQSDEIKNFEARVQLHVIPEGLMPGMTAQVEILTARSDETLVIPPQALTVERGQDVCYVARADGLRRREVTIGQYHHDMIEVTEGLSEGDQVVMEPNRIDRALIVASDDHAADVLPRSETVTESSTTADLDPFLESAPVVAADTSQPTL